MAKAKINFKKDSSQSDSAQLELSVRTRTRNKEVTPEPEVEVVEPEIFEENLPEETESENCEENEEEYVPNIYDFWEEDDLEEDEETEQDGVKVEDYSDWGNEEDSDDEPEPGLVSELSYEEFRENLRSLVQNLVDLSYQLVEVLEDEEDSEILEQAYELRQSAQNFHDLVN